MIRKDCKTRRVRAARLQAWPRQAYGFGRIPSTVELVSDSAEGNPLANECSARPRSSTRGNRSQFSGHLPCHHLEIARTVHANRLSVISRIFHCHKIAGLVNRSAQSHRVVMVKAQMIEPLGQD